MRSAGVAATTKRGDLRAFNRRRTAAHRKSAPVRTEHRRASGAGRRQRDGAELGSALHPLDIAQQRGERGREMRLVEQHQGVVSEEPRVRRAKRAPVAVAREEQPRPHHIDGADEDRGPRGVEAPRTVVGEPPAQHPEPDAALGRMCRAGVERVAKRGQRADARNPRAHRLRRLVDDGAAVDDVDDAPRQGGVRKACEQCEQHAGRLAEPGGDVHRVRNRAASERGVEAPLPRVGVVADDGAKVRDVAKVVGFATRACRFGRGGAGAIAAFGHGALRAWRDVGGRCRRA